MSSRDEATLPATRPRARKSLGHVPSAQDVDKENMTADVGLLVAGKRTAMDKTSRKSRSKSIGPGGFDALQDTAGNKRKELALDPQSAPKSILKPTMPPLREIPAHISTRRGSPKKATPQSAPKSENLIDFDIALPSGPTIRGTENLANPFQVGGSPAVNETRVTLRTEEEQQAAAREREEKERQELEKEVISRRDARRKSLANRRVSFAPEATLHTWDVVVEYQDSTTSSSATNSTRRASSATIGTVGSPHVQSQGPPSSDASEPPSTPPEQVEEEITTASPAHQRDLHQKKRRRSSGIPPMNFNNPDDAVFSSSPLSGSDVDEVIDEDDASASNSDSGDDGTMMSMEGGETTNMSMASIDSGNSTSSSNRLEEALRQAARQAGTQGIDFDENGDQSMADEEEEGFVASFKPWSKPNAAQGQESQQDQENVNPFSAAFKAAVPPAPEEDGSDGDMTMEMAMDMTHAVGGIISEQKADEEEMSMDVTRAFGNIIQNDEPRPLNRRKSVASTRRQSTRRRSSGDGTMDLTMAMGGIHPSQDETVSKEDEDITMEFTTAVGGLLGQCNATSKPNRRTSIAANQRGQAKKSRESINHSMEDETMDMTVAMGGIMPQNTEVAQEQDEPTIGMDMTTALGGILPPQMSAGSRNQAKKIMEMETDFDSSPFRADVAPPSPPKAAVPTHTIASETGSPSLAVFRGKGLRRSAEARQSTTPKSRLSHGGTPTKKPATPSKQLTPQPARPTTPGKTPPSKNVVMRTSSPKRLFKEEIKASSTPKSAASKTQSTPNKLFQQDKNTGNATPSFVLTPKQRSATGVGLDRVGLGSPRVAAILDRRGSIGEQARSFVPGQVEETGRGVRFDDPRLMENEIDEEREQEGNRENGRKILEREADQGEEEKDATLNLKEMIESLTPKKKPLRGRKSLHVGAAKGILGKRPAELDNEDEDDEDNGGVKRIKGHQGSPVKAVHLQAPPTKAETTTGRMTRAARKSLEANAPLNTPSLPSPEKPKPTTPRHEGHFRNAEASAPIQSLGQPIEKQPVEEPELSEESFGDDRIQLQDFLNMTSIRFMELTTTKRRHTIAPKTATKDGDFAKPASLEDCVAAGAATIPMLELFQHACHELKRYISEGRRTVREIETETFEENPPLFREYISASPDIKIVMDNQLKNVKTHARLLSKGQWYDWRMTLLGTLREGLFKTAEGMIQDEESLDQQQELIDTVLPELSDHAEQLQQENGDLQSAADEVANCDQEQLSNARHRLIALDAEVNAKKQLIADLRKQLQGKETEIEAGIERKQTWQEEIREAEKIREECRGWTSHEISLLKAKVDAIEKEYGWTITGVSGTTTSMTYLKEVELVFDASSFRNSTLQNAATASANTSIDLWYIGASRDRNPLPSTTEKEFFLQCIRDHIRGLTQASTPIKDLLSAVSVSWNKVKQVVGDIQDLTVGCPTEIVKTSDDSIMVRSTLLISPLTTKVEIIFHLSSQSGENGIDVGIAPTATVVYGERFNEPKMGEFLLNRCGDEVEEKDQSSKSSWGSAVAELGDKLLARGRK